MMNHESGFEHEMNQCYFEHDPDALIHPDHTYRSVTLMNQVSLSHFYYQNRLIHLTISSRDESGESVNHLEHDNDDSLKKEN